TWFTKEINKTTQFVQIEVNSGIIPYEIKLYGLPTKNAKQNDKQAIQLNTERPTMDKIIGINAFIDDPIDKIKVAGFVREYHNWRRDALDNPFRNNTHACSPSDAGGGWDFDKHDKTRSEVGTEVGAWLKGSAQWIPVEREEKPWMKNTSST